MDESDRASCRMAFGDFTPLIAMQMMQLGLILEPIPVMGQMSLSYEERKTRGAFLLLPRK
jgi:hypothetical protein